MNLVCLHSSAQMSSSWPIFRCIISLASPKAVESVDRHIYLRPYSLDLKPIEFALGNLKALL
jgi:transposase